MKTITITNTLLLLLLLQQEQEQEEEEEEDVQMLCYVAALAAPQGNATPLQSVLV